MATQVLSIFGDIVNSISNAFSGIANWISDKIGQWIDYLIYMILKMVYLVLKVFFILLDFIQLIFRKMAGLDTVYIGDTDWDSDLALLMFRNENVLNALLALILVAVVMVFMATFVAIIRSHWKATDSKQTAIGPIVGKAFKAVFAFIFVPLVCYFAVFVSNGLLKTVDQATRLGDSLTISGQIFVASAMEANRARTDSNFATNLAKDASVNCGIFLKDNNMQYATSRTAAEKIDDAFAHKTAAPDKTNIVLNADDYPFMFHQSSPGEIERFDYMDVDLVFVYYDLRSFNWLFAFVSGFFILTTLLVAALGIIQRLFEITILFAISPPFAALMPLDDGKAFGAWTRKFAGSVLIMYGTVVALNFFFIIAPILQTIDLFGSDAEIKAYGKLTCDFFNAIAHILFIMCGSLMVKDFSSLINELVTDKTASLESRGENVKKEARNNIRKSMVAMDQTAGRAHKAYQSYMDPKKQQARQQAKTTKQTLKDKAKADKSAVDAQVASGEINKATARRMKADLKEERTGKKSLRSKVLGNTRSTEFKNQMDKAKTTSEDYANDLATKRSNAGKRNALHVIKNSDHAMHKAVNESVQGKYYSSNATTERRKADHIKQKQERLKQDYKKQYKAEIQAGKSRSEARRDANNATKKLVDTGGGRYNYVGKKEIKPIVKQSKKDVNSSRKNLK